MKVLDVSPFHEGIQRNITMLARLEAEIQTIERTVEALIAMEDSLKGEGGNAIRAFYAECHVPFLQFFLTFQSEFKSTLERMDNALDTLEPNPSGFIRESFLEGEAEEGLEAIAKLTERLTNEANNIMDGVSDIVALPPLDDSDVQAGVGDAKIKRDDTVTQLHEFDANQTTALAPIETDLTTMMTWISDIESLFTDGVTDVDFPRDQWADLSAKNSLKTELAHRTGTMAGVNGMTDVNGQPGMMLGVGASGGNAVLSPQGFGDDPGALYGSDAYSLSGMATQASPLHDAGISSATMLASSAVISSGTKPAAAKVTSTPAAKVKKPKKKNKVFGFLKDAADFLILDDVKTVVDPNASLWDKGVALFSVTPTGKAVKAGRLGVKLVQKTPFGKAVSKKVDQVTSKASINRKEAYNSAKDLAGVPRSQQPSRQWQIGDDIHKKGGNYKNYEYSSNSTHHGRYYEYDTPYGKRVVVEHVNDGKLHTHAGKPKAGANPFEYDFKKERYSNIYGPNGDHHIYYNK